MNAEQMNERPSQHFQSVPKVGIKALLTAADRILSTHALALTS